MSFFDWIRYCRNDIFYFSSCKLFALNLYSVIGFLDYLRDFCCSFNPSNVDILADKTDFGIRIYIELTCYEVFVLKNHFLKSSSSDYFLFNTIELLDNQNAKKLYIPNCIALILLIQKASYLFDLLIVFDSFNENAIGFFQFRVIFELSEKHSLEVAFVDNYHFQYLPILNVPIHSPNFLILILKSTFNFW